MTDRKEGGAKTPPKPRRPARRAARVNADGLTQKQITARKLLIEKLSKGSRTRITGRRLAAILSTLAPNWIQPPPTVIDQIINQVDTMTGFVKPRTVAPVGPIEKAIEVIREATSKRLANLKSGRLMYFVGDGVTEDQGRSHDIRAHLEAIDRALAGSSSKDVAQWLFGEAPAARPEPSWYSKCRLFAVTLAPAWRPSSGDHTLDAHTPIVVALHALLLASGETDAPKTRKSAPDSDASGKIGERISRLGIAQFLAKNRDLLNCHL